MSVSVCCNGVLLFCRCSSKGSVFRVINLECGSGFQLHIPGIFRRFYDLCLSPKHLVHQITMHSFILDAADGNGTVCCGDCACRNNRLVNPVHTKGKVLCDGCSKSRGCDRVFASGRSCSIGCKGRRAYFKHCTRFGYAVSAVCCLA